MFVYISKEDFYEAGDPPKTGIQSHGFVKKLPFTGSMNRIKSDLQPCK